jgi:hypothetical protein
MHWESALGSAIEVAIGIAGFSGIVAAVGRRAAGHWSKVDQLRLRILLTASGAALVSSFLPFVLIDLIDASSTWRITSALLATHTAGISFYRFRQASAAGIARPMGLTPLRRALQAGVVVLLVANAIWLASAPVYVLGVLWGLLIAFLTFVRLLLDSWHAGHEG